MTALDRDPGSRLLTSLEKGQLTLALVVPPPNRQE